jgi:hypothetical protein
MLSQNSLKAVHDGLAMVVEKMSKYNFTDAELLEQLEKQIRFIRRSCSLFDEGHEDEAARLAVCIRVMVHDTPNSKSLLQHLKKKGKINYWDSASEYSPTNYIAHLGLTCMSARVEGGHLVTSVYEPAFNGPHPTRGTWQSFQWWWNRQPVIVDSKRQMFTRKDLVLAAANKDGGAHVDHQLDDAYAARTRFNSAGWSKIQNGHESPFDNDVAAPSIRQVAFEILKTLEPHFPQYIQFSSQ